MLHKTLSVKQFKIFILLGIIALASASCRKNNKFYSCICSNKDTMFVERIGRMPKNTAYGSCKIIQDQYNVDCQVEIRN